MKLSMTFLRWGVLRSIGNSATVKLTILIPVIGYLILFNDTLVGYLNLARNLFDATAVPGSVSWRLLFLYFGLSLTAVASIIYAMFCPNVIKRFGSSAEFIAEEGDYVPTFAFEIIEEKLKKSQYKARYVKIKTEGELFLKTKKPEETEQAIKRKYDNEILALYYAWSNGSRPFARIPAGILYLIGFAFVAIPSVNVFYRVSVMVAKAVLVWLTTNQG